MALFADYLQKSPELASNIQGLEGMRLMCHCRLDQACHGDAIIQEFNRQIKSEKEKHLLPPMSDDSLRAKAEERRRLAMDK